MTPTDDVIAQNHEAIQKVGLNLYQPSFESDNLLLKWWFDLHDSGGLNEVFHENNRKLSTFFQIFQPPTLLVYTLNEKFRINSATWFVTYETAESAALVSVWASPTIRHTRKLMQIEATVYRLIFTIKKRLYAITRQKNVALFEKIGYSVTGYHPEYFDDGYGVIITATEESFKKSKVYSLFG